MNCEFADNDREIKTQIVQNCLSHKLLKKALQNPEPTLTQLLDAGKAMEISKSQAETIEEKQNIKKLSRKYTRRASKQSQNVLMQELMELDIHPVLYNWINAFLFNRKQAVRIGGHCQIGNPRMVVYLRELNLVLFFSRL